jgi:putative ATP-binding cassette transporter
MTAQTSASQGLLSRETLVRLRRAVGAFAASDVGGRAAVMASLLVVFLLAINGLNVVNSFVGRYFMTSIERRDGSGFVYWALCYAAVFAASTVVAVVHRFTEERLGLLWREWLTRRAIGAYLQGRTYYELNAGGGLTNPDQRIADDVRSFTTSTLSLALIFLNGTLTLIAFSGVLWSISRMLFVAAAVYAALGSLIAFLLGRPLLRLNYDQSDREADFRSQLIHVRENAESIALLDGEPQLESRLFGQVRALAANLKRIIAVNRNLGFFTTGYNYMIQLIPALLVAPLFISGKAEFGVIPQSSMAFAQVIGAFSLVVNQFQQLSSYAAVLARLHAMVEATEGVVERPSSAISVVEDPARLAFENLSLVSPQDGQPLVRDLSLEVTAGHRLLVTAPSDLVTNALLRVISGLWRSGSGRVVRPPSGQVILVPERPYLPPGPLRAALVPGAPAPNDADDRIWQVLKRVGVEASVLRVGGLDVERDWNDVFSLDEQRLIAVARLFLASPRFVVLERPAAGLGLDRARELLAVLAERRIGTIVFGAGTPGRGHFDATVEIAADGTWARTAADRSLPPEEGEQLVAKSSAKV